MPVARVSLALTPSKTGAIGGVQAGKGCDLVLS